MTLTVGSGDAAVSFTQPDYLYVSPLTNYVDCASADPVPPCATPETAATNVLDVLDYTMEGSVVLVADGVYDLWKQIEIQSGVTVVFGKRSGIVDIGCFESSWGTPGFLLLL